MGKQRDFSKLVSFLEMWTLLSCVAAVFYLIFFSPSHVFILVALNFCMRHPPLGILTGIVLFCLFILVATPMLFPLAVRIDRRIGIGRSQFVSFILLSAWLLDRG